MKRGQRPKPKKRVAVNRFPKHLCTTATNWRNKKRTEWADVMAALDRFSFGTAYVPLSREFYAIKAISRNIEEVLARKDWVAW